MPMTRPRRPFRSPTHVARELVGHDDLDRHHRLEQGRRGLFEGLHERHGGRAWKLDSLESASLAAAS